MKKIKGFTLVECIVALFILTVMSLMFLLMYANAMKIYKESAILHQKFDQQINIAATAKTYDATTPADEKNAYIAEDRDFKITYSSINSTTESKTCTIKSTLYEVNLDRNGLNPNDSKYDDTYKDSYNYSYYHTGFTKYSEP